MQNEKLQCKRESTGVLHFTLLFFVFSFTFYVFLLPQAAQAGLIVNRPMYLGLTDGLVGYWSFDGPDMSQSTNNVWALDRSGQGNNGVLKNTATSSVRKVGKIGQGLSFDGVNDYVSTGNIAFTNDIITVSTWINIPSYGNGDDKIVIEHSTNFNLFDDTFALLPDDPSGRFSVAIQRGGYRAESFTRPSVNEWHHLSVILDI